MTPSVLVDRYARVENLAACFYPEGDGLQYVLF
jgi:hypothetical protein